MSCGMWFDYERNFFLYMHIPDSVCVCMSVCTHVWCGMYGWVGMVCVCVRMCVHACVVRYVWVGGYGVCLSSKQMIIHLT